MRFGTEVIPSVPRYRGWPSRFSSPSASANPRVHSRTTPSSSQLSTRLSNRSSRTVKNGRHGRSTDPDPAGRHSPADAAALVEDRHAPAGFRELAGREQAADAGTDDHARTLLAHGYPSSARSGRGEGTQRGEAAVHTEDLPRHPALGRIQEPLDGGGYVFGLAARPRGCSSRDAWREASLPVTLAVMGVCTIPGAIYVDAKLAGR